MIGTILIILALVFGPPLLLLLIADARDSKSNRAFGEWLKRQPDEINREVAAHIERRVAEVKRRRILLGRNGVSAADAWSHEAIKRIDDVHRKFESDIVP